MDSEENGFGTISWFDREQHENQKTPLKDSTLDCRMVLGKVTCLVMKY